VAEHAATTTPAAAAQLVPVAEEVAAAMSAERAATGVALFVVAMVMPERVAMMMVMHGAGEQVMQAHGKLRSFLECSTIYRKYVVDKSVRARRAIAAHAENTLERAEDFVAATGVDSPEPSRLPACGGADKPIAPKDRRRWALPPRRGHHVGLFERQVMLRRRPGYPPG
jgi:hypothetical protein